MTRRLAQTLTQLAPLTMAAAVILLPVTSLPLLWRLMGHALVSPPSAVLVGLMALLWLPAFIMRGGLIPRESAPLWAFVYVALLSAGLAFFRLYPAYKGYTIAGSESSALLTLGMAAGFYLIFSLFYRGLRPLNAFFVALNVGGMLLLAWSLVQLYVVLTSHGEYDGWMVRFQTLLSVRPLTSHTFYDRLTGFAYEPSWLANMLNLLYLPYWLAATVTGFSVFPKVWRISLENLLLPAGVIVLVFSFSRIGLAAFLLTLAYLCIAALIKVIRRVTARRTGTAGGRAGAGLRLVVAIVSILALVLLFWFAARGLVRTMAERDPRMARLFDLDNYFTRDPYQLARNLAFGERLVYWAVGWRVFAEHPLLGVGPGNAGYFFIEKLPIQGWQLAETIRVADALRQLPNVKSLWSRLLAETGLVGFSAWLAWLFVLWRAGGFLKGEERGLFRMVGWMGTFVLVAMVLEGFSIDSFAMPYLWVALGVLTAASASARSELISAQRNALEPAHNS